MTADIAVQPFQFLVSETEIGLAHRQQIGALIGIAVPAAEGEVGIEGGALTIPALRVHEQAVDQPRVAPPFVPEACASARYIRDVAALEHDALSRLVSPRPERHQVGKEGVVKGSCEGWMSL